MNWLDLLSVPFALGTDGDCWGLAREINRRLGRTLPEVPCLDTLRRVEEPYEVGDVLVSDPEGLGHPSHAAVVVEPGWALTTSEKHGPRCLPIHRVRKECGVWRSS